MLIDIGKEFQAVDTAGIWIKRQAYDYVEAVL